VAWGCAAEAANKNKTTTFCLVGFEVQFGDLPEAQAPGQFAPQIVPGVLQGGHGQALLAIPAAQAHLDGGVLRSRADHNFRNRHVRQPRIGELEPDDLAKLFPYHFGDSLGTMLHKEGYGLWVMGCGKLFNRLG
jgi:hypothetical protein